MKEGFFFLIIIIKNYARYWGTFYTEVQKREPANNYSSAIGRDRPKSWKLWPMTLHGWLTVGVIRGKYVGHV